MLQVLVSGSTGKLLSTPPSEYKLSLISTGEKMGGNADEAIKGLISSPELKYSNLPFNKFVAVTVTGKSKLSNEFFGKNFLKNSIYFSLSIIPGLFIAYNVSFNNGVCSKKDSISVGE